MRIQTLSIVVGGPACNARCPFCVSRMIGFEPVVRNREVGINVANFRKACRLAEIGGTTTALITGEGEPTLYPGQIGSYLDLLAEFRIPLIELQTNGIELGRLARLGASKVPGLDLEALRRWRDKGLNTIALSAVRFDAFSNNRIYGPDYPDLDALTGFLHESGFTVRLCVMMMRHGVESPADAAETVAFCRLHGIEQLTLRPIRKPKNVKDAEAAAYVDENRLTATQKKDISDWAAKFGTSPMSLMYGTVVYDIQGQTVCFSDCLTVDKSSDQIRSLIFYPNGRLAYDWQYGGAVILGGRK